jgi:hypothetical protein
MRRRNAALGLAATIAVGVVFIPQQAQAATGTTLYVNNMSGACGDSGSGTQAVPYCTIQKAADAATAGDTVLNVTVTQPTANGVITAFPSTSDVPDASNLNFRTGETAPNRVMVSCPNGWDISLHNDSKGSTELVVDVYGYFS